MVLGEKFKNTTEGGADREFVPIKLDKDSVAMLRERWAEGVLIKTLMKDYNLSKANVYRYLKGENIEAENHG